MTNVLTARLEPGLFDKGQLERLVVASGGNLRDLFAMAGNAADEALVQEQAVIGKKQVDRVIGEMRVTYERRLGQNPFDEDAITYDQKRDRLKCIYDRQAQADVPDSVLYALLRARAVQEFNGEQWFDIHPLVVDVLIDHNVIEHGESGGTL